MKKKKDIRFYHDEFETTCFLDDGEVYVVAIATCEPEHQDYYTDLAGENLAYYKALEKYYHEYATKTKQKIDELERLADYLFPPKFFNDKKVPKDTIFGVEMVKVRLDKEINNLKELYTEYKEYELAMAGKITEWVIYKDNIFKKFRKKAEEK